MKVATKADGLKLEVIYLLLTTTKRSDQVALKQEGGLSSQGPFKTGYINIRSPSSGFIACSSVAYLNHLFWCFNSNVGIIEEILEQGRPNFYFIIFIGTTFCRTTFLYLYKR